MRRFLIDIHPNLRGIKSQVLRQRTLEIRVLLSHIHNLFVIGILKLRDAIFENYIKIS